MSTAKSAKTTTKPRRKGWRIPHSMPKDLAEYKKLRELLGPRAYHKPLSEWPVRSEAELEELKRNFREPTPGEIRAFRLRHGILRDWTIMLALGNWEVSSPRWERTRPTPYSRYVRIVRLYSLNQEYFDELRCECMEGRAR